MPDEKPKPGQRVLVEAVVKEVFYRGCAIELEEVHPLPSPVWVARDNRQAIGGEAAPDIVRVFCDPPKFMDTYHRWQGKFLIETTAEKFAALYGPAALPEPGTCRKMHLLAIDAEEG